MELSGRNSWLRNINSKFQRCKGHGLWSERRWTHCAERITPQLWIEKGEEDGGYSGRLAQFIRSFDRLGHHHKQWVGGCVSREMEDPMVAGTHPLCTQSSQHEMSSLKKRFRLKTRNCTKCCGVVTVYGQWSSATQVSRARHKQQMLEQSLRPLVKRPKIVVCHITGKYCVETPWDPWGNFPPTKNYTRKIEIIKRRFFSVTNC